MMAIGAESEAVADTRCVAHVMETKMVKTNETSEHSMLFALVVLIILQLLLLFVWAVACCCCRGRAASPVASEKAPEKKKEAVETRTVLTQSQVTYTWHRVQPRFLPLGDRGHGAWPD